MEKSEEYYVQANGELKFIKNKKFHLPIDGFNKSKTAKNYGDESWIDYVDILPSVRENWEDGYNPFSGARLI